MIQSLSLRLSDSLPASVLMKWRNELALAAHSKSDDARLLRCRIERFLDAGHGECWLSRPELAWLVEEALSHFDGQRYRLLAWCIMPNHIHALIETTTGHPLAAVIHSWKSYTGTKANQILNRRGEFWQREYLDRYVRDAGHYQSVIAYIEDNPVKAGLARIRTDWPWSSARFRPGSAGSLAGESRMA